MQPRRYAGSAPDPIRFSANLLGDAASSTLTERDQMLKHTYTHAVTRYPGLNMYTEHRFDAFTPFEQDK